MTRADGPAGGHAGSPATVAVAGSMNSEIGGGDDWHPASARAQLRLDADGVWKGAIDVPVGEYAYKITIDGTWHENYGVGAVRDGADIPLRVTAPGPVRFFYDHRTHWATDSAGGPIVTVPGSHQTALGAPGDWDPAHMGSWLQDHDGDGIFTFSTASLPGGTYAAKVAHDLSWDENYGSGGDPGGPDIAFTVPDNARTTFTYDIATHQLEVSTRLLPAADDLLERTAHWLRRDLVALPPGDVVSRAATVRLLAAPEGGLSIAGGRVVGGADVPLIQDPAGLPPEIADRWPHLAHYVAVRLPSGIDPRPLLTGQLAVAADDGAGDPLAVTGVQLPGVLDDVFDATEAALGLTWAGDVPSVAVWAPTAKDVALELITGQGAGPPELVPMIRRADGVWSARGEAAWRGGSYRYRVRVYVPEVGSVQESLVTDPYSVALTTDSARSVVADLADSAWQPAGWDALRPPTPARHVDSTIYELHVRDFSIGDAGTPAAHRGRYLAFTDRGSAGMRHLAELAAAGLNTVHLLPVFDFGSVGDVPSRWREPACDLAALSADDPAGEAQQACVTAVAGRDGFNWGYDPWHHNAPEGSYATDPEGPVRSLEFREMVAGLAGLGLRVVMDVVYNHTFAAAPDPRSVLDRIVPGYYHRLSASGAIERSTCCPNTAAEHAMMTKLVVDSVLLWARQYKVGGFRFDLMGHHPRATLVAVRAALDALTEQRDGIDGASLYVYGEGWNFGEVANNARFVQATQLELVGTGIGSFNDRLRDAVRGGSPGDSDPRAQGFGSGLFTEPNGAGRTGPPVAERDLLLADQDRVMVGLAGNLRGFPLTDRFGAPVTGAGIDYNGAPTGYAAEPAESVQYVDAHDNETLFDALALKLPVGLPMSDRVRMNTVCLATVALGQGPMLWHAGTDLLRSKSLDRNSFDSGDWFNRIDWSGVDSTFGSGLPPAADNRVAWPHQRARLADPALVPGPAEIAAARAAALDLLRIRFSSPLFRLGSAALIARRVSFPLAGPGQPPGVIAMVMDDTVGADLDPARERVVVILNATPWWQAVPIDGAAGLVLHPVQRAGADPVVRLTSVSGDAVSVPPRTVAVLQS